MVVLVDGLGPIIPVELQKFFDSDLDWRPACVRLILVFSDGESLGSGLGSQGHAISVFLGFLRSIEGLTPAPLALCVCKANMELRALRRAAFSNPLILPSLGAFEPCVDAGHPGHHPK